MFRFSTCPYHDEQKLALVMALQTSTDTKFLLQKKRDDISLFVLKEFSIRVFKVGPLESFPILFFHK